MIRAKFSIGTCLAAIAGAVNAAPPAAPPPGPPVLAPAASFGAALTDGRPVFNLRPRFEYVDQENKSKHAEAFTLRTLAGWQTAPWHGWSTWLEFIGVTHIGLSDFNDDPRHAAVSRFPMVADPENYDINQAYIDFAGIPATRLRVGRQLLKLDNVRFIGNVEFRQVMQVFDGFSLVNQSLPQVELLYAHFVGVKNINADYRNSALDIAHVAWKWSSTDSLVGYSYLQDQAITNSNTGLLNNGNRILGVRADGQHPFGPRWKALYTVEYAKQDDYADGDRRIDAHYLRIGGGPGFGPAYVRFDYERLASNDGVYAFQTALGTNHLFQGWADLFLTTPREGIEDYIVAAGYKLERAQLLFEYHYLDSEVGNIHFGEEVDVGASYAFTPKLSGKIEWAMFEEGDRQVGAARKPDTTKFWLTLIFNY